MNTARRPSLWIPAVVIVLAAQVTFSQEELRTNSREILRQAAVLVPDIPQTQQASVASNIANTQARAGDLSGALSTVLLLKDPNSQAQALGSIAFSVDQSGNFDGALKLMQAAPDSSWKDSSYQPLAVAHAQKGDFSGAFRVVRLIKNPSTSVNALTAIAAEQYKAGNYGDAERTWDEARAVTDRARKADPSYTILLNEIATSRGEAGQTAAATALLDEVAAIAQSQKPVDSGLLATVAIGFAQIGEITSAIEIAKTLPPGTNRDNCFMLIAEKLMKAGDPAGAKEAAGKIADAQIRKIAFQDFALTQADAHAPATAVATTKAIPTAHGRAEALAILAYEEAQKGDKAATATVELASEAAKQDSANTPAYVFAQIAVTRAILGDFDTAEEMTRHVPSEWRWWPMESIAGILVNSGNSARALKLADAEKDAYPKACALLGIASALMVQEANAKNANRSQP